MCENVILAEHPKSSNRINNPLLTFSHVTEKFLPKFMSIVPCGLTSNTAYFGRHCCTSLPTDMGVEMSTVFGMFLNRLHITHD